MRDVSKSTRRPFGATPSKAIHNAALCKKALSTKYRSRPAKKSKASDASAKLFIRAYEKFGTSTMKEN